MYTYWVLTNTYYYYTVCTLYIVHWLTQTTTRLCTLYSVYCVLTNINNSLCTYNDTVHTSDYIVCIICTLHINKHYNLHPHITYFILHSLSSTYHTAFCTQHDKHTVTLVTQCIVHNTVLYVYYSCTVQQVLRWRCTCTCTVDTVLYAFNTKHCRYTVLYVLSVQFSNQRMLWSYAGQSFTIPQLGEPAILDISLN
jgi:hypothetical protein